MAKIIYIKEEKPTYGPAEALVNSGITAIEWSITQALKCLLPLPGEKPRRLKR